MTLSIGNILNNALNQMGPQASKKSNAQDGEFVFEFQGREYTYASKAAYMEDIKDGKIDNGKTTLIGNIEKFAKDLAVFGELFKSIDESRDTENTESEEIVAAEKESEASEQLTTSNEHNIKSIDENANKTNEETSENKEVINEKNEKIDELKKEIKEQEKAEKAAQEEELAKAIKKAEKEYDPAKHGDNKDAYIKKQTAGIIDSAKGQTTELKDQLKTLEAEVKNLFGEIANRNKISRQNNFTKLNMSIQNTFSTAATAEAEDYKKTLTNLDVAA